MNFKAIQKQWYDIIEKAGFEDHEDHETLGIPLKKWSGSSSLISIANNKLVDIIDLHVIQDALTPMRSSFPEPFTNKKEEFMHTVEFHKACKFLCQHGNSKLTQRIINNIWQAHCDGDTERLIAKKQKLSNFTIHHTITRMTEWMNTMSHNLEAYQDEPLNLKATVIIRNYDHDRDAPFIYSSWRNALWYAEERDEGLAGMFYKKANQDIKHLIRDFFTTVKIACLSDDPDQIVGYSVLSKDNLEWVYVKIDYRKQGVATLLCKGFQSITTPYTAIGRSIAEKKKLKIGE